MAEGFVKICAAPDIGVNESKAFDVGGRSVLVCNTKEGLFAVSNICTHQLQALEGGKLRGHFIFCPLHGQRFNLKDGSTAGQLTDKPLDTFRLKIDNGDIFVNPLPVGAGQD